MTDLLPMASLPFARPAPRRDRCSRVGRSFNRHVSQWCRCFFLMAPLTGEGLWEANRRLVAGLFHRHHHPVAGLGGSVLRQAGSGCWCHHATPPAMPQATRSMDGRYVVVAADFVADTGQVSRIRSHKDAFRHRSVTPHGQEISCRFFLCR